jgi:3-deoxy-D-manno-octulosonic-acid transferase
LSKLLYHISIYLYQCIIWLVSPFNKKAKSWLLGRKNFQQQVIDSGFKAESDRPLAWFHCASLGEFEQARPVIEKYKATFSSHKILLTFFSPSGYEIRKNYEGADYVFYLPIDTAQNAQAFIETFQPSIAFFVKYEFWYHYLRTLAEKNIPTVSFSAIFRANQVFFKSYGAFNRNILTYFSHIFVQNKTSLELLKSIHLQQISIGGDTRFDRVKQIADAKKQIAVVEQFKDKKPLLIVGSCWEQDFEVIAPLLNTFEQDLKVIIAPHEIHDTEIEAWRKTLKGTSIRFSSISKENTTSISSAQILFIDNIGMLSSLYQYAEFAWIGGAYRKGLHNTLEAATFGLPIFFGNKNYQKFQEAIDLISIGGAKSIANTAEFKVSFEELYYHENLRKEKSALIQGYVQENLGGTDKIIKFITELSIF